LRAERAISVSRYTYPYSHGLQRAANDGELLFGLKHYRRFVDCEASETCIPSHRAGLLCHTPTSAKLAMISWLIVMFGEPGWSRGASQAHGR
jgi:hypothetical protein